MNSEGVCASSAASRPDMSGRKQAAARYDLPYIVDVGVDDQIVNRGLKNTFRFAPGSRRHRPARSTICRLNDGAGKPMKTITIVHEDGLFGSGLAKLLKAELPTEGL